MDRPTSQTATSSDSIFESERERRVRGILSQQLLHKQNIAYAKSGGVSENNRTAGFVPGYLNTHSGVALRSRFADGKPAPIHLLDGLPDTWVLSRDKHGQVLSLKPGVIAGFLRDGILYTREEAARATNA